MKKPALTRTMSKKVYSPDNFASKGFLVDKNEILYSYSWTSVTVNQFIEQLKKHIKWSAE